MLSIAPMTLFKRKIEANKVAKNYYFVSGTHFHLTGMKKCIECRGIFKHHGSQRVKYIHPVSILIEIGVLVRKNEFKNVYFLALSKNVSPLVNDNEHAGAVRGALEKN